MKAKHFTRILEENLEALISGERTPAQASAVARNATVQLRHALGQMEYAKARGEKPHVEMLKNDRETE
jgi:hypothetical protein